jgi:hypothetical protein
MVASCREGRKFASGACVRVRRHAPRREQRFAVAAGMVRRVPSSSRRARFWLPCSAVAVLVAVVLMFVSWQPPTSGRLLFGGYRLLAFLAILGALWFAAFAAAAARSRLGLLRAMLVTFAAGGTWVVLELGNAVVQAVAGGGPPPGPVGGDPLPNADLAGQTPPDIAHAYGLPCAPYAFRFQTNAWGMRNPPDRSGGAVYCLGDSLVVAIQLPWAETTTGLLERGIAQPVANVCLIGKSPQEMHAVFDGLALDVRDRVVLQFVCEDNDLLDSASFVAGGTAAAPPPSLWQRSLTQRGVLALQRWTQPVVAEAGRRRARWRDQDVLFLWHHPGTAAIDAQVPVVCDALQRFGASVRARGGHFGVVLVPAKLRVVGPACELPPEFEFAPIAAHCNRLEPALQAWSATSGVPVLTLTAALQAVLARGELPWLTDDTHLSAAGHAAAADAIQQWPWFRSVRAH